LSAEDLANAQAETRATRRRRYSFPAHALFVVMDLIYGKRRDLAKFRVLELIARVPYQAWEQVAYVAITHKGAEPEFARRIHDRVMETRAQQDNELWHLLILTELIERGGERQGFIRHRILPQLIALVYYHLTWALYVVRPAWSYRLNADFEDHAEHEYMEFVAEHPEFDAAPYDSEFTDEHGSFATVGDLFRQIGYDERVHKNESLAQMSQPRFDRGKGFRRRAARRPAPLPTPR
jgi:hypothetical protein